MKTQTVSVLAHTRRRGAIGKFSPDFFILRDVPVDSSDDDIKEAWFAEYGQRWELHHFNRIVRIP